MGEQTDAADPSESDAPEAIEVPNVLDGERVDRALSLLFGWSRSEASRLVAAGDVLVDGREVAKSHRLVSGTELVVRATPRGDSAPEPEEMDLDVRYADDALVVVSKPAGLVVHPGAGHHRGTLVHGLLAAYPELAGVGDPSRPGIVHRLDKDTSGLLAVARTQQAYDALVDAFARRAVERSYDALVWGELDAPRGVIDAPIGRSAHRRTRMAVREAGRAARTRFEVVAVYDDPTVSRCLLELETGRTHQVRVHCAAIGHPVVGDATYGGQRESIALERPFLHATRLVLAHPLTGERVALEDPLPSELQQVLAELGAPRRS